MTAAVLWLAELIATISIGADMVCAEARDQPEVELVSVAAVVRARADRRRTSPLRELRRPRQFVTDCPRRNRGAFVAPFLLGLTGAGPALTREAVAFTTKRAARRVLRRWCARGLVPIPGTDTAHVFWRVRAAGEPCILGSSRHGRRTR